MMREISAALNQCALQRDLAAIVLPRLIGDKKAREMILLGEIIDTNEALRLGLVNQVAPSGELNQQTEAVLAKLRVLSSSSLQMTRTALELGKRGNFESALTEVENLYLHE